jgi:hypothetical protein
VETSFLNKEITDPAGRVLLRVVGGVLSWVGVGLLILLAWLVETAIANSIDIDLVRSTLWASALLLVGALCTVVGFRMFLNRPNKHGPVLSPTTWAVFGSVFAVTSIFMLWGVLRHSEAPFMALSPMALSAMSFYMRKRAKEGANRAL